MQSELSSPPQHEELIFQAAEVACTLPMTVKQYLAKHPNAGGLTLITNPDETGKTLFVNPGQESSEFTCWDCFEGWSLKHYADTICYFISLIDVSSELPSVYINRAFNAGVNPFRAVNNWFKDQNIQVTIEDKINGYVDIDLSGECLANIYRACILQESDTGDLFKICHGENAKSGGTWTKELITSLITSASVFKE